MKTLYFAILLLIAFVPGCARSRVEALRDRSALVEQHLSAERDRALNGGDVSPVRQVKLDHLQTLRAGLSMVNISIATVPVFLKSDDDREIGYSVLGEALGTIDWNIPIYQSSPSAAARPYPNLFSPQSGLDFTAIQSGARPGQARPSVPGIAR